MFCFFYVVNTISFYQAGQRKYCSQGEITDGYWVPVTQSQWADCKNGQLCILTTGDHIELDEYTYRLKLVRSCSNSPHHCRHDVARVIESMRWIWQPTNCDIYPLKMLSKSIGVVGDSINEDFVAGIKSVFPKARVYFTRLDYLGVSTAQTKVEEIKYKWSKVRWLRYTDILLLNSGAHWYESITAAEKSFKKLALTLREIYNGTIIFRTTIMGHNHCENYYKPHVNNTASLYNWASFSKLNDVIVKQFRGVWVDRFYVLNVSMFEQRGDGHFRPGHDCLHYCVPGASTLEWTRLLLHLLREKHLIQDTL